MFLQCPMFIFEYLNIIESHFRIHSINASGLRFDDRSSCCARKRQKLRALYELVLCNTGKQVNQITRSTKIVCWCLIAGNGTINLVAIKLKDIFARYVSCVVSSWYNYTHAILITKMKFKATKLLNTQIHKMEKPFINLIAILIQDISSSFI